MSNNSNLASPTIDTVTATSTPAHTTSRTSYASVAATAAGITPQDAVNLLTAAASSPYTESFAPGRSGIQPNRDRSMPPFVHSVGRRDGRRSDKEAYEAWSSVDAGTNAIHTTHTEWNQLYEMEPTEDDEEAFLAPSYMQGSLFLESLEEAHYRMRTARHNITKSHQTYSGRAPNRNGVYSTSQALTKGDNSQTSEPSSVPKLQSSHRVPTYEVIEHIPSSAEDGTETNSPLPSRWNEVDKRKVLDVSPDGQQLHYTPASNNSQSSISTMKTPCPDHEAVAARANFPMPLRAGIYYYEVLVESKGREGMIGVGFSSERASLEKLPGWEPDSWAYHGDDGKTFCCQLTGKHFGPTFGAGDTIGCGVNFVDGSAFYTKNGKFLGVAFREIKTRLPGGLYPSVGMKRPHAHLVTNFGQRPFIFNIDFYVRGRQRAIEDEIAKIDLFGLRPPLSEEELCKELVAQYLSHDGWVKTAEVFATELAAETAALERTTANSSATVEYVDPAISRDATQRQEIRTAVLSGDINTAISLTNTHYPRILPSNSQIKFLIGCRKYIEMMLESAQLRLAPNPVPTPRPRSPRSSSAFPLIPNSRPLSPSATILPSASTSASTSTDTDAEMRIETSHSLPNPPPQKYTDKMAQILTYAQTLSGIATCPSQEETLSELFGMLSYPDARMAPQAHWPDYSRDRVAAALNSAILTGSGREPTTAIERMYSQTFYMQGLSANVGGPGALLNLRRVLADARFSADDGANGCMEMGVKGQKGHLKEL